VHLKEELVAGATKSIGRAGQQRKMVGTGTFEGVLRISAEH